MVVRYPFSLVVFAIELSISPVSNSSGMMEIFLDSFTGTYMCYAIKWIAIVNSVWCAARSVCVLRVWGVMCVRVCVLTGVQEIRTC